MENEDLAIIYESFVNGNFKQFVCQVHDYKLINFIVDLEYYEMLTEPMKLAVITKFAKLTQ